MSSNHVEIATTNCRVILDRSASTEQLREAVCALRRVLSRESMPPITTVTGIAGAMDRLVELMRSEDDTIAFDAAWSVTNVASGTSTDTGAAVEAGAVPAFIDIIQRNLAVNNARSWDLIDQCIVRACAGAGAAAGKRCICTPPVRATTLDHSGAWVTLPAMVPRRATCACIRMCMA